MTPEEINCAIAASVGRKQVIDHYYAATAEGEPSPYWDTSERTVQGWLEEQQQKGRYPGYAVFPSFRVPDYYRDLNEIHEVVMGMDPDNVCDYVLHLHTAVGFTELNRDNWDCDEDWILCNATAAQRCEAYLRTIRGWKD
jgi:hypothetical protein